MDFQLFVKLFVLLAASVFLIWLLRSYFSPLPTISQVVSSNPCSKSLTESDQFICESDELWNERKALYQFQDNLNMQKQSNPIFFLTNWEPNFHCSHAQRIGRMGDGGKWVCDLFRLRSRPDCLIYSAGSNGDFSFEISMKKAVPNCEIHTFDVNFFICPQSICKFHQIRFGDGANPNTSKTWQTIVEELQHTDRTIDVFKIDIEGSEYHFFPVLFKASKSTFPRQVLVEVHPYSDEGIHSFFELFRANNYVIFNKEPNLIAGSRFFEYTFLKLNSRFFSNKAD